MPDFALSRKTLVRLTDSAAILPIAFTVFFRLRGPIPRFAQRGKAAAGGAPS